MREIMVEITNVINIIKDLFYADVPSQVFACPLNPPKGDLYGIDFYLGIFQLSPPSGDLGGFDDQNECLE
jgi:hypothetical protein